MEKFLHPNVTPNKWSPQEGGSCFEKFHAENSRCLRYKPASRSKTITTLTLSARIAPGCSIASATTTCTETAPSRRYAPCLAHQNKKPALFRAGFLLSAVKRAYSAAAGTGTKFWVE